MEPLQGILGIVKDYLDRCVKCDTGRQGACPWLQRFQTLQATAQMPRDETELIHILTRLEISLTRLKRLPKIYRPAFTGRIIYGVNAIVAHLQYRGYDAELLVPEFEDIPLKERVRRANQKTCRFGHPTTDTILISIHVNAAGSDGKWHNATGWSAYTFPGHTESDRLADCLYRAAEKYLPGHMLRTDFSDGDPDLEEPFYILKHTYCPAVLTENGFMDSRESS